MKRKKSLLLALATAGCCLLAHRSAAQLLSGKLLYNSIQPCRVVDTRGHHGSVVPGAPYTFRVVGTGSDLSSQGGSAAGCAIPGFTSGKAQTLAVMINLVAVAPLGAGDFRAYPADSALAPVSSVVNYAPVTGLNLANGLAIPVGQTTEGMDITVAADVHGAGLVADVVGYFTKATRQFYLSQATATGGNAPTNCVAGFHFASLYEIRQPELLTYDTALGVPPGDGGSGPPAGVNGWVRTGNGSSNQPVSGTGNCNGWTSSAGSDHGSVARLDQSWADVPTVIAPWEGDSPVCSVVIFVWCVED